MDLTTNAHAQWVARVHKQIGMLVGSTSTHSCSDFNFSLTSGSLQWCSKLVNMGTETNRIEDRNTPEYLAQLLKDKKQIQAFPNVFIHLERVLDEGKC